ncbi:MAG TPA: CU044_2847 family protein [Marmoricola sp.]|nr:CU044_2847 family protein [Marmoricola sp.]
MSIVEFETEDGTAVLVKVPETGHGELVTRGLGDSGVVERAQRTFEAALRPIRVVSEGVLAELNAVARHPDSVSVEFGLEFTANSSAVVVGASGSASIRVQLTWQAPPR